MQVIFVQCPMLKAFKGIKLIRIQLNSLIRKSVIRDEILDKMDNKSEENTEMLSNCQFTYIYIL